MSGELEQPTLLKAKKSKVSRGRQMKVPVPMVREPAIPSAVTTTSLALTEEVVPAPATDLMAAPVHVLAKDVTPAPAPLSESVFKSGMRSVKRLFFGGHIDPEEAET
jgi:hypothetical protein